MLDYASKRLLDKLFNKVLPGIKLPVVKVISSMRTNHQ